MNVLTSCAPENFARIDSLLKLFYWSFHSFRKSAPFAGAQKLRMESPAEMVKAVAGVTPVEWVRVNGVEAEAQLETSDGALRWSYTAKADGGGCGGGGSGREEQCLSLESEMLGIQVEGRKITVKAFAAKAERSTAAAASAHGGAGAGSGAPRARYDYVLEMATEEAATRWNQMLRDYMDSLGRPKKLFIILNPFGGKKSAMKVFHNEVEPLLVAADIQFTMIETKYQLHAQEVANSLDVLKYEGIVCVSGDGVLVEVVNGLLQREDWDVAIKVPLGVIPAGTGNGMAKSLLHSAGDFYSAANATFAIIRGHKRALDVSTIVQGQKKFFSVLLLTWGLIADIDIESEKYRWMGSARLDFYAVIRIMNLRKYQGQIQFVPAPGYEECGEPVKQTEGFNDNFVVNEQDQGETKSQQLGYPGPVAHFTESEWRSLDGPFIVVWLNNVPFSAEEVMSAPEAKFSDGFLDAVILRDCPKSALLGFMLKMNDGSYLQSPYVTYLKVKAFRLKPGNRVGDPKKGGIIDSDGEVIAMGDGVNDKQQHLMAYGPLEMTVDQGLATMFSPK